MTPDGCAKAIDNLTSAAPAILFSSSPLDLTEATHHNVQPIWVWLNQFASRGFYPDVSYDASYIAPQAMLLRKSEALPDDILLLFADYLMARCHTSLAEGRSSDLKTRIDELEGRLRAVDDNGALRSQFEQSLSQRDVLIEERQALSQANLRLMENYSSLVEHHSRESARHELAGEDLKRLRLELDHFASQTRKLELDLAQRLQELDQSTVERTQLGEEFAVLAEANRTLTEQFDRELLSLDTVRAECQRLRTELAELEFANEQQETLNSSLTEECRRATDRVRGLEGERTRLLETGVSLSGDLSKWRLLVSQAEVRSREAAVKSRALEDQVIALMAEVQTRRRSIDLGEAQRAFEHRCSADLISSLERERKALLAKSAEWPAEQGIGNVIKKRLLAAASRARLCVPHCLTLHRVCR